MVHLDLRPANLLLTTASEYLPGRMVAESRDPQLLVMGVTGACPSLLLQSQSSTYTTTAAAATAAPTVPGSGGIGSSDGAPPFYSLKTPRLSAAAAAAATAATTTTTTTTTTAATHATTKQADQLQQQQNKQFINPRQEPKDEQEIRRVGSTSAVESLLRRTSIGDRHGSPGLASMSADAAAAAATWNFSNASGSCDFAEGGVHTRSHRSDSTDSLFAKIVSAAPLGEQGGNITMSAGASGETSDEFQVRPRPEFADIHTQQQRQPPLPPQLSQYHLQQQLHLVQELYDIRSEVEQLLLDRRYLLRVADLGHCCLVSERNLITEGETRYCARELLNAYCDFDSWEIPDASSSTAASVSAAAAAAAAGGPLGGDVIMDDDRNDNDDEDDGEEVEEEVEVICGGSGGSPSNVSAGASASANTTQPYRSSSMQSGSKSDNKFHSPGSVTGDGGELDGLRIRNPVSLHRKRCAHQVKLQPSYVCTTSATSNAPTAPPLDRARLRDLVVTKADIFSLGASVYELCLGRPLGCSGDQGMQEWHDIR